MRFLLRRFSPGRFWLRRFLPVRGCALVACCCCCALLAALVATAAAAGCGFLSSDEEASLPGGYASFEFRVRRVSGEAVDVGERGAELEMTLTDGGQVHDGRLRVPADGAGGGGFDVSFAGTYERTADDRVTFDFAEGALSEDYFHAGTPLSEVAWLFYESDATLRALAGNYVVFLDKVRAAGEE